MRKEFASRLVEVRRQSAHAAREKCSRLSAVEDSGEDGAWAEAYGHHANELERMETLAPLLDRLAAEWKDPRGVHITDLPTDVEYAAVVAVVNAWKGAP
jgi:hypothetical protein